VQCAGRTDAGVHATGQVIHFDCAASRPGRAWTQGANTRLPDDIAISWASPVDVSFHARFSACYRRYRYLILNRPARPGVLRDQVCWVSSGLDERRMHEAAQVLLGEQDFSAFRAASCQSRSPMRYVDLVRVQRERELVVIDIRANAFLHHMVRNIAGALIEVGRGEREPGWLATVLAGRDRTQASATAPPGGLYLVEVGYPGHFGLPAPDGGPWFMPLEPVPAYNGRP